MASTDPDVVELLVRVQALELIVAQLMTAHARSRPEPERELSDIAEHLNSLLDGFKAAPTPEVAQMVELTRQSIDSLLTQSRVGLLRPNSGGRPPSSR